jgi:hypothetical protein
MYKYQDGVGEMNRIGIWRLSGPMVSLAAALAMCSGCGEPTIPPVKSSKGPPEVKFATAPGVAPPPPVELADPAPEPAVSDAAPPADSQMPDSGQKVSDNDRQESSPTSDLLEPGAGEEAGFGQEAKAGQEAGSGEDAQASASPESEAATAEDQLQSPVAEGSSAGELSRESSEASTDVVPTAHNSEPPVEEAASDDAHSADKPVFQEVLFEGWPTPDAAIMITGRQYGYLEPCGCAGLANQKGGMVRRYVLLEQLREKNWPVTALDAGNQIRRFGRQAEIKFQITVEGLRTMGYEAIGFGPDDLRLPAPELIAVIAAEGDGPSEFVCANAAVLDQSFTSTFRVVQVGKKSIGITSVLGARNAKMINNDDIILTSAEEGIDKVWPDLQSQRCDLYVLIAHATIDESIALGQKYPQFPVVITTGGAGEPTIQPELIEGTKSKLIQVGTKGMFAGVVGLFDDPSQPLRYQRIPLDGRFPDSPEMLRLLAAYQDQLQHAGWDGLGIRAQPHPSGRTFVGSDSCADCHPGDYDIWKDGHDGKGGPHWHATETLVHPGERSEVPRHFDPECISCHVIGWNPQKYYPYESGYLGLKETPDKLNVGCENCHGPGSAHVAAELGDIDATDDELKKYQVEMQLPLERAEQKCMTCHDLDNSPAFQEEGAFERYWEKIKH